MSLFCSALAANEICNVNMPGNFYNFHVNLVNLYLLNFISFSIFIKLCLPCIYYAVG
jgi:hypothetical protein